MRKKSGPNSGFGSSGPTGKYVPKPAGPNKGAPKRLRTSSGEAPPKRSFSPPPAAAPAPVVKKNKRPFERVEERRPEPSAKKYAKKEKPVKPDQEFDAPVAAPEELAAPAIMFSDLGLSDTILKAVTELGFESPTPIQAKAIPVLNAGRSLIGQAQTGTGKTAAFAIPLIGKIDPSSNATQALVMAPTRELAVQVAAGIYELAKHTGARVVPVYGGQPIDRQFKALKTGAQIVVGTPGRLLDHLRRGSLSLSSVVFCALDEADEMMALGFAEDMDAILGELGEGTQLAFFSATMPPKIAHLVKKYLGDAQHISIEPKRRTVESTNQTYYDVPKGKKLEALARVLDMEDPGSTIVFCRTRQETNDLCEALRIRGYNAEALHGDMNQGERDRVMKRFREMQADILVATDVAARGLDIDSVTHVVNYDIPWDVEQYIHRIGRTGRAGRSGSAITLVEGKQRRQLEVIERVIGAKIKPAKIPTAADIAARRREIFKESIREALEANEYEGQMPTVQDLLEEFEPTQLAAAALQMLWQSQHSTQDSEEEGEVDFERPELGMARMFMSLGRQDGLRPGDVVGAIVGETGLNARAIGVIDILDRHSFFEVSMADAPKVIEAMNQTQIRGKRVKVTPAQGNDEQDFSRRRRR